VLAVVLERAHRRVVHGRRVVVRRGDLHVHLVLVHVERVGRARGDVERAERARPAGQEVQLRRVEREAERVRDLAPAVRQLARRVRVARDPAVALEADDGPSVGGVRAGQGVAARVLDRLSLALYLGG
jgi:AmiR/NasT family two-component response regulator